MSWYLSGSSFVQPAMHDLSEVVDTQVAAVLVEFDDRNLEGVHVHVRHLAVQQKRVYPVESPHRRTSLSGTIQSATAQMTSLADIVLRSR